MTARGGRSPAFTVVLTLFAGLLVYLAVPNMGTVIRAARADGTPGVFVPRELFCVQHPGHESCVWTGEFRSGDGMTRRAEVEMYGSDRASHREGEPAPAVDVGSASRVYGPGGSNEWVFTALLLVAALAIVWFLYGGPLRRALGQRSRPAMRARRSASGPGTDTMGQ
ncbi:MULTISPECIES: hypothetical protein [unclassified Streptosporangium]|uniref:hypothetical protein n=1 Tax=unclassified Streptosporangium TaxID=2632669 RepID=UPI002E2AB27F|nr:MULTISPECIES: hypothetical protein [unclassified Streptosporangium]